MLIKTHFPALRPRIYDNQPSQMVVRIVRHPVDSIYSFAVRQKKVTPENPTIPRDVLKKFCAMWSKCQHYWNAQPNVLTLLYEDLLEDPQSVLELTFKAMGLKVSPEKIREAIAKYPPEGKPLKHIGKYPKRDLSFMKHELGSLMKDFHYTLKLEEANAN